jgi:hypothetical protein
MQCHKCNSEKLEDKKFTPQELAIVPYNIIGEKYVFKDSLNDSMSYSVSWRNSNMDGPDYENFYNYDSHCLGNYCYTENVRGTLVGTEQTELIQFRLFFDTPNAIFTFVKTINLYINYTKTNEWFFGGSFYINDLNLAERDSSEGRVIALNSTLDLGPKTFSSVYTLVNDNNNLKTVYYNFSRGIVGFKSNDNHLWYLAN